MIEPINLELLLAAKEGDVQKVKMLLSSGANMNVMDLSCHTPLLYAIKNAHTEIISLLLHQGADVSNCRVEDTSKLQYFLRKGSPALSELLIKSGISLNLSLLEKPITIHQAIEFDDIDGVNQCFLVAPSPLDEHNSAGFTPLHVAARIGNERIVRLLISKGCDINKLSSEEGVNAVYISAEFGNEKVLEILLSAGGNSANRDCKHGRTPLIVAAIFGHSKAVEVLIRHNANLDDVDGDDKCPALIWSIRNDYSDICLLLIDSGANLNFADYGGVGIAHIAAMKGKREILERLISIGYDVNRKDDRGRTALQYAEQFHQEVCVGLLRTH